MEHSLQKRKDEKVLYKARSSLESTIKKASLAQDRKKQQNNLGPVGQV